MNTRVIAMFLLQNPIIMLVLLAHVLADFHWQSQLMADKKLVDKCYLGRHLLIVVCPLIVIGIVCLEAIPLLIFVSLSHVIIDTGRYFLAHSGIPIKNHKILFGLDQALHFASVIVGYWLFPMKADALIAYSNVMQLVLFLALVTKPINVMFKILFDKYSVKETQVDTIGGAGAVIGNLERVVMAFSLLFGQFAAIGLVFTAKSIARYNKISENQSFAEYYLIGSLFSVVSVIAVYVVLYGI